MRACCCACFSRVLCTCVVHGPVFCVCACVCAKRLPLPAPPSAAQPSILRSPTPLKPTPPAVVLLNDTALFDLLFDDAHFMDFVGALEYEPGARLLHTAGGCCCGCRLWLLWLRLIGRKGGRGGQPGASGERRCCGPFCRRPPVAASRVWAGSVCEAC